LNVTGPVPPYPFSLIEPFDGDTLRSFAVDFIWESSFDPNEGEDVSYKFWTQLREDSSSVVLADTIISIGLDTLWNEPDFSQPVSWWVMAFSGGDTNECERRFSFQVNASSSGNTDDRFPYIFAINSIYPNPFNSTATISFELDKSSHTTLKIMDILGREVARLHDNVLQAGTHTVVWNAQRFPSGVYLIKLESMRRVKFTKVLLMK